MSDFFIGYVLMNNFYIFSMIKIYVIIRKYILIVEKEFLIFCKTITKKLDRNKYFKNAIFIDNIDGSSILLIIYAILNIN